MISVLTLWMQSDADRVAEQLHDGGQVQAIGALQLNRSCRPGRPPVLRGLGDADAEALPELHGELVLPVAPRVESELERSRAGDMASPKPLSSRQADKRQKARQACEKCAWVHVAELGARFLNAWRVG